jgi:hypothetical protein
MNVSSLPKWAFQVVSKERDGAADSKVPMNLSRRKHSMAEVVGELREEVGERGDAAFGLLPVEELVRRVVAVLG